MFFLLLKCSFLKRLAKSDIAIRSNALDDDINIGNRIHNKGQIAKELVNLRR